MERKASHTDLILSPALESKGEGGLKNLGLGKGESSGKVSGRAGEVECTGEEERERE